MNHSFSKLIEQVLETIRAGMLSGRWKGTLPGRERLAAELGVSHATIEDAMRRLAKEGMLVSQGPGKRRRIVLPDGGHKPRQLHIRILPYESADQYSPESIDLLQKLHKAGFSANMAPKSLLSLGMNVKRVARMVHENPADAWIVTSGSHEVLQWFSEQPVPAYARYGMKSGLRIAGCGVRRDIQPQIRRLVELGHRRIVLLVREEMVKGQSLFTRQFLEALESEGITPGSYHLPEWGFQPEGLRRCLDSLFKVSAPTALIIGEDAILLAVRDCMARRGMLVPRDISLICLDQNPLFSWCDPLVDHFAWDMNSLNRHIVRWVKNVAIGKQDHRQIFIMARFFEGGTVGPAPKH